MNIFEVLKLAVDGLSQEQAVKVGIAMDAAVAFGGVNCREMPEIELRKKFNENFKKLGGV